MSAFPSITHSDERIVGCDVEKSSLSEDWYVETAVSGESIEGFPRGASRKLRELVLRSAGFNEADITTQAPEDESAEDSSGRVHAIELLEDDLIVGGAAHKATLRSVIADARQRVFIHSTFLSLKNLEEIQDVLESAADLDVRVDVFWDKEEDNERHAEIYAACRQFACRPEFKGLVRISDFPTRSHSKVILADDGRGEYFCVIGSCNWLTSPFKSFEMSVRLRSPSIVSDCSGFLERLIPLGWHDLELRRELLEMSRRLRSAPAKQGLGKARLLLQGDHEGLVRRARDKANRRIFVASNKAGAAVENQVLAPFDSIESTRKVEVAVYYQSRREDSGLTPSVMQALKDQYSRIKIRAVVGAHAKLLSWDSDHAVVTSLNWLSKDASHSNPVGEFGVYIESPGIAEKVENLYLQSCPPSLQ
jgi:phosphatidylserine/phosphatidylglycerophosphate/cardiolipin synthase-like enzyme